MTTRIHLGKERHKFSAAHMTVFPDGSKERLHGHNFRVEVSLECADLKTGQVPMADFKAIKGELDSLCAAWDERTLLAERSPHFKIVSRAKGELEFTLCGKRYVLPEEDTVVIPVDNITVEALSALLGSSLAEKIKKLPGARAGISLEVRIEETPGQAASWTERLN